MKRYSKYIFLIIYSLLLTVTAHFSNHFLMKTLSVLAGLLIAVIYLISAANRRSMKLAVIPALSIVLFITVFLLLFKAEKLGDFIPDQFSASDISEIQFTLIDRPELIIWTPGPAPFSLKQCDDRIYISGGSVQNLCDNLKGIPLRNYWWPGAVESNRIYDFSAQFKQGEKISYLGLIPSNGGILLRKREAGSHQNEQSYWLVYNDISECIDQEIYTLLASE